MRSLLIAGLSVVIVWFWLFSYPQPAPPRSSLADKIISVEITLVMLFASAVLLKSRHWWSVRAVGLFYVALSQALLYGASSYRLFAGYGPNCASGVIGPSCQPRMDAGLHEAVLDLSRACSVIGGPAVAFGLLVWCFISYKKWKDGDIIFPDFIDRRKHVRREEDRRKDLELRRLRTERSEH